MDEYTVKVIVAVHKPYEMPVDKMYLPIHVGAAGKDSLGYQRDDEGENISNLNPYYCELTGLYWAWKNLNVDYIGLVHYRRLFAMNGHILTEADIQPFFGNVKVFTPSKRRYYVETLKSHYAHTHCPEHLDVTRSVVIRLYPDYLDTYDKAIGRTWGYMFNMMIMEKTLLDNYCTWLFDILNDVFRQIDTIDYPDFTKRYVGRISEILFNVWLEKKIEDGEIQKNEIKELDCNLEENWLVKIPMFLKAKFFGKKYEGSF
mgnify:CR=1 FL=1